MNNMKTLTQLRADLRALEIEYNNINTHCSYDDIECVSDRYQEALEGNYYKSELRDRMAEIREQIINLELDEVNSMISKNNHKTLIKGSYTTKRINELNKSRNHNEERYYALPDAQAKREAQHLNAIATNGVSEHDCATDHCPRCGDYEGDQYDCPNGCFDTVNPTNGWVLTEEELKELDNNKDN